MDFGLRTKQAKSGIIGMDGALERQLCLTLPESMYITVCGSH